MPAPPEPLRTLFCHHTSDIMGGSDRSLYDLVTHLPKEKFAPVMALKTGDPLAEQYRASGVTVYELRLHTPRRALDFAKLFTFAFSFFPSVYRIVDIIHKEKIQVVHVNTLFNLQGALAARIAGRPLVWHIRELMPDSRVIRIFLACVKRWAARVIPNSYAVAESVAQCGGRVTVIHNGIDLGEYDKLPDAETVRKELGAEMSAPVATVIGRLEMWKGQHVLLEAFPAILCAHPSAQLWIVGGPAANKPEYLDALKRRVTELGLSENIRFTGIRRDIPALLAASDVLVLPSVTPEPFGRTLVEGMAARCPVVATKQGGPLEIVREGVSGMLVTPDDPAALAKAVNTLFADSQLAKRMGDKGREFAYKYFSLDRVVVEVGRVLEDAARQSNK